MPILNHRDYRSARAQLAQLARALGPDGMIADIMAQLPTDVAAARRQALHAELERLQAEIAAYEKLRGATEESKSEPGLHVDDLGMLPIVGRIARRWSQRELADRLELKEQQVQRYERERYAGISLARYERILSILGIELQPRLLAWNEAEASRAPESRPATLPAEVLREIRKRGWITPVADRDEEKRQIAVYVDEGVGLARGAPLHRKSEGVRPEEAEQALQAWRARVLHVAAAQRGQLKTRFNIADSSWLRELVALSVYPDGPLRAAALLGGKGVLLVIEPQLVHTLLDGAALLLLHGAVPVIGMTLRHDRLDNFWHTLLHELGHIFLHFNHGLEAGFIDDDLDSPAGGQAEIEADSFARSHLLADEIWNTSPVRYARSAALISSFAQARSIHPAIVAGRIRRERNNYTLFGDLVGRGQVRCLFINRTA